MNIDIADFDRVKTFSALNVPMAHGKVDHFKKVDTLEISAVGQVQ